MTDTHDRGNTGYLAFDPGVSTGYAEYNDNGEITRLGILRSLEELEEYLATTELRPRVVICEDYIIHSPRQLAAHKGSKVQTTRAIGMVRMMCRVWGSKFVLQSPRILSIGFTWAKVRRPRDSAHRDTHDQFAHAHGTYYLVKNGIKKVLG